MYNLEMCSVPKGSPSPSLVEQHRHVYLSQGLFVESTPTPGPSTFHLRLQLPPETGNGSTELIQINQGLGVSLCDYVLNKPIECGPHHVRETVCFNLLMSGEFEAAFSKTTSRETIQGGELWLCRDFPECLRYTQPAHRVIRGLAITLPHSVIESWLNSAHCGMNQSLELILHGRPKKRGHQFHGLHPLSRCSRQTANLVRAAARLMATKRNTVCGLLHFESLALDLLTQILTFEYPSQDSDFKRVNPAVDEAVDILRAEWADPPTIAVLSRRVGLNDCYLKADFRRRTGKSIGEYVRTLRMEHALELIESGRSSITEAALAVGYSNPGHFSAAFKRHHGRLPSKYLGRG